MDCARQSIMRYTKEWPRFKTSSRWIAVELAKKLGRSIHWFCKVRPLLFSLMARLIISIKISEGGIAWWQVVKALDHGPRGPKFHMWLSIGIWRLNIFFSDIKPFLCRTSLASQSTLHRRWLACETTQLFASFPGDLLLHFSWPHIWPLNCFSG